MSENRFIYKDRNGIAHTVRFNCLEVRAYDKNVKEIVSPICCEHPMNPVFGKTGNGWHCSYCLSLKTED